MVELADTQHLKCCARNEREGSSPFLGINNLSRHDGMADMLLSKGNAYKAWRFKSSCLHFQNCFFIFIIPKGKNKMKTNTKKEVTREIEILNHQIKYSYDIDQEMSDSEQEHVTYMIEQGYTSGELNYVMSDGNTENRGWWEIKKNYELELLNTLKNVLIIDSFTKIQQIRILKEAKTLIKKVEEN